MSFHCYSRFLLKVIAILWLADSCIIQNVTSSSSTSWDQLEVKTFLNAKVQIVCHARNLTMMDIVRVEYVGKDGRPKRVADKGRLKEDFARRHRIKYESSRDGTEANLTLYFDDVREEDAGEFHCTNLRFNQDPPAIVNLFVLTPIKESYIAVVPLENFNNALLTNDSTNFSYNFFSIIQPIGQNIEVNVGSSSGLVCYATSDSSNFQLTAELEGRTMNPDDYQLEILEYPKKSRAKKTEPDGDASDEDDTSTNALSNGAVVPWKAIVVTKIDWSFNNKNFTCVASADMLPAQIVSISLRVTFLPEINCESQKLTVEIGKEATIRCTVRANPEAKISWMDGGVPLMADDVTTNEQPMEADEQQVTLKIAKVESRHLKSYTIVASNAHGSSEFSLVLAKKPGPRTMSGSLTSVDEPKSAAAAASGVSSARQMRPVDFNQVISMTCLVTSVVTSLMSFLF